MAGFRGVTIGAPIEVKEGIRGRRGVITCLLGPQGTSAPTHFLTAGHLFSPGADETPVYAATKDSSEAIEVGRLWHNLLTDPDMRRDLAIVTLTDAGRELASMSAHTISVSGVVFPEMLYGRSAQAYFATRGRWSPAGSTFLRAEPVRMRARTWHSGYLVHEVIAVDNLISIDGDSGTALCAAVDSEGMPREVFGSCIGTFGRIALFEPLYKNIQYLSQLIKDDLQLWSEAGKPDE